VENHSPSAQTPAPQYKITDTQETVYRPVKLGAINQFAYRTGPIPAHSQIPEFGSAAEGTPIQGALLLFKVNQPSFENRPLVLSITDPRVHQTATADLDV
jgi:hypothetical protein